MKPSSKATRAFIASHGDKISVVQIEVEQPYVFVKCTLPYSSGGLIGNGFAKANYPDPWDTGRGIALAKFRACKNLLAAAWEADAAQEADFG